MTADWDAVGRLAVPVAVALVLDAALGDPPGRWHPVAWMGTAISLGRKLAPTRGRVLPLLAGGLIVVIGIVACVAAGWVVTAGCHRLPVSLGWVLEGVALKVALAARGLAAAAGEVRAALDAGDRPAARRLLAWHLVSRDTADLTDSQVAAAVVESVAENASDGVVAPLFWFAVGGLPAALAYRFANTADAMLGYRDIAREWLGKVPARLDDLLNLLPARLTGVLILLLGGGSRRAVRVWWRDCRRTTSPNAGHPMAAAAGVLGVELEKVGAYTLGAGQRPPTAADIRRTVRLLWRVTATAGVLVVGVAGVRGMWW
jgi:adenosylcobinamide-phosphate synthase